MTTNTTYYYKKTRGSVVDVICDELTYGEEAYILTEKGTWIPTVAPSLLINEYDVSTGWNDDGTNYILARVGSEEMQNKVVEVAKKFGKGHSKGMTKHFGSDKSYWVKIYIDEEDFDTTYFDPNVLVRGKKAS